MFIQRHPVFGKNILRIYFSGWLRRRMAGTQGGAKRVERMAGGPAEMKVLGMLWKQAATGIAIGGTVALTYYQAVSKQDQVKIAAYYAKQDAAPAAKESS